MNLAFLPKSFAYSVPGHIEQNTSWFDSLYLSSLCKMECHSSVLSSLSADQYVVMLMCFTNIRKHMKSTHFLPVVRKEDCVMNMYAQ